MDGLKKWLLEFTLSSITGFDKMVASAEDVLTGAAFNIWNVWSRVVNISDALKPFCYIVIGICLLLEMAQVLAKVDTVKWEHGLKLCVKMVLAKLCIDIAPTFLRACYRQASLWIDAALGVGGYNSMGALLTSEITTQLNNVTGLWSVLGLFVTTMLVSLAIKICGLLIQVIAFGRMFELYVYLAVSPLPCAFFPLGNGSGDGFNRITMKFFKSFIAVCLQGVMIILCIRIFYLIIGSSFSIMISQAVAAGSASGIVSELCYTMLMGTIVLVMSVTKCGSWAKGIIDAM